MRDQSLQRPAAVARRRWTLLGRAARLPLLLVSAIWGLTLAAMLWDRHTALEDAEHRVVNLNFAFAEHTQKTLQSADQALRFMRALYIQSKVTPGVLNLDKWARRRDLILSDMAMLSIADANGDLVQDVGNVKNINVGDRTYFKDLSALPAGQDPLKVGAPAKGKISGQWMIPVSRRIESTSQGFDGIVTASVLPQAFVGFYKSLNLPDAAVTGLVGTDGVVRVRHTAKGDMMGTDLRTSDLYKAAMQHSSGTVWVVAVADGISRLYAFTRLEGVDLVAYTGIAEDDILGATRERRLALVFADVLITLFAVLFAGGAYARSQRQDRLRADLDESHESLHRLVQAMSAGADEVATAGESMSMGAQSLAIHTDTQTATLERSTTAIRSVTTQFEATKAQVAGVDRQCEALRSEAESGVRIAKDAASEIEHVHARAQEMNDALSMIEGLAFQTTILALNANIEAARAGVAGRGFAVVATEVKALAHKTTEAAAVIKNLIERTSGQVNSGIARVHRVCSTFEDMNAKVNEVVQNANRVNGHVQSQYNTLQDVLGQLTDVYKVTNENAELVATSVLTADAINESAQRLRKLVERARGDHEFTDVAQQGSEIESAPAEAASDRAVEFF